MAAHMAEDLILKYHKRSLPLIKGDTVKIMRGEFSGHTGKVRTVHIKKEHAELEGVSITKVDGKKVPRTIHASNILITKLNLADPWRRKRLEEGLPEEIKKEIEKEAKEQIEEQERIAAEEALLVAKEAEKAKAEAEKEIEEEEQEISEEESEPETETEHTEDTEEDTGSEEVEEENQEKEGEEQ